MSTCPARLSTKIPAHQLREPRHLLAKGFHPERGMRTRVDMPPDHVRELLAAKVEKEVANVLGVKHPHGAHPGLETSGLAPGMTNGPSGPARRKTPIGQTIARDSTGPRRPRLLRYPARKSKTGLRYHVVVTGGPNRAPLICTFLACLTPRSSFCSPSLTALPHLLSSLRIW